MPLKKTCALLLCAALLLTVPARAVEEVPANSARAALLMDADTGRVLFAQNADEPLLIASTTKIMTALVVIESCDLEQTVDIKQEWTGVEGSSVYLTAGERLTVRELLYCLLLQSGNDAALALACVCAGSAEEFAARMNERAASLGLTHSHFANPHGLDAEDHYGSARDLALTTAAALQYEAFCEIVATQSITIGQRYLTNHNKLLKFYDGAAGVKTGYTKAAGRSLVSAAARDGLRLIAVTLSDPNDWADHAALLDYGFAAYRRERLCTEGETLLTLPVIGGQTETLTLCAAGTCEATLAGDETVTTRLLLPRFVYAAVERGQRIGWAEYYVNNERIARTALISAEDVPQQSAVRRGLWARLRALFE